MKLYQADNQFKPHLSQEQFKHIYIHSAVVSTESVSLFFAQLQDSFSSALSFIDTDQTRYAQDALSQKRAAVVQARDVKFQNFRHEVFSKPESFDGYYTEYLKDLLVVSKAVAAQTSGLIETLKMTIGTFINEFNDEKVDHIYGQVAFATAKKELVKQKQTISVYFKAPSGKVKTTAADVLKNMQDIQILFGQAEELAEVFNENAVKAMQTQIQSVTELVDTLIQVNVTSGVLNRSLPSKAKLIDAIETTAQSVEYYHALLANWIFYCKAFKELTDALVKFPSKS